MVRARGIPTSEDVLDMTRGLLGRLAEKHPVNARGNKLDELAMMLAKFGEHCSHLGGLLHPCRNMALRESSSLVSLVLFVLLMIV